jgi:hypothetical protein
MCMPTGSRLHVGSCRHPGQCPTCTRCSCCSTAAVLSLLRTLMLQSHLHVAECAHHTAAAVCCLKSSYSNAAITPACALQPLEVPSLLTIEEAGAASAVACPKPGPGASTADKSKFIQDKYVGRKYVATAGAAGAAGSREAAQQQLWDAVGAHDVR